MHSIKHWAAYLLFLNGLFTARVAVYGQSQQLYALQPLPLEVSAGKTVSLSFAAAVKNLDRGSADLLAQKAKGTENVVLIRAARKDIQPTSLIVITADGDLHTFEVSYQQHPVSIGLQILPKRHQPQAAQISQTVGQNQIQEGLGLCAEQAANLRQKTVTGDLSLSVQGIYILGPVMYVRLSIGNRSVIDYDIETLRVLTSDNKQIKRSASQQDELPLIGRSLQVDQIKASEEKTLVLAMAKTTLPESKSLIIQLTERGGSRHLTVRLKAKHLAKIAKIPAASNH